MSDEIPIIGIDLGTTFSCIAAYRNGKAEMVPDESGNRLIPSIVYFDPKSGAVHVGKIADELSPRCPGNCLRDSKRILGRHFDDEYISKYRCQKDVQFSVIRGADDKAVFQVNIKDEQIIKTPEDVSAEILKYLRKIASDYVGNEVTEVVISIPAYFSNAQRKATKKATELAGLKLLNFITEPSAGALHYVKDKNIEAKLVVFDWGGGTLDVSLIEMKNKVFEVKSVYGDTLLGGRNIDYRLFEHFYTPVDEKFNRRLHHKCEDLKKRLSTIEEYSLLIECYDGADDLELSLTREQFEGLNKDIFQKAVDIVEYGLADSGWKKSEVQEVVLVGGSTRIPKIRNVLEELFERNILKIDLNPDEAVAIGACLQAEMLKSVFANAEQYKITEVTPLSLGIRTSGNYMSTVICRNSSLPAKSTITLGTCINDQEACTFHIIEGERKNTVFNNTLGTLRLEGLPRKRAGDVKIEVTFHLDDDGILTVTASEESTGQTNKLVVTLGEFRLSDRKVEVSLKKAAKHKLEDEVFKRFVSVWNTMRKKCQHILYESSKITSESDRTVIEQKCHQLLDYSENLDYTEMDDLEIKFRSFNESVSTILNENQMQHLI